MLRLALLLSLLASPALAGTMYIDTGGSATNGCSRDVNSALISGATSTDSTTTITLPAGTDLTGIVTTAGATQDAIYLTNATVSNRKVYWITGTAGSGGATPTVTVDTAPACTAGACGAWAVGGRCVLTNASQEGSLRAGDTVIFNNSPASQAGTAWTFRNAGTIAAGRAVIKGKTGVRPVLTTSGSGNPVISYSVALVQIENLELQQTHATTGNGITAGGAQPNIINVKVSDGVIGINASGGSQRFLGLEVTGVSSDCIQTASNTIIIGSYLHGCGGDGVEATAADPNLFMFNNVVAANTARGIYLSGASTTGASVVYSSGNTVYGNGNSGLEVTDADTAYPFINDIFMNNGDAAGEYNVEWVAGTAEAIGFHGYNDFYHSNCQGSGTGGPACVSGMTVNGSIASSEIVTDPLMTNPGSGDFTLSVASGAKALAYPGQLLGATGQGYLSAGAQQIANQATAGGGLNFIGGF